jgi:hypothetical protein
MPCHRIPQKVSLPRPIHSTHVPIDPFYIVKEIADCFKRNPMTIDEAIMKVGDLPQMDKLLEKVLKRMEENLVKGQNKIRQAPLSESHQNLFIHP